ncbi:MAG: hypothetical protein DMG38_23910 [Acidobacteria bacterium]|nr:MAG: hypothetical protein DMG38_23910 [Acidobacteriota bacterium]
MRYFFEFFSVELHRRDVPGWQNPFAERLVGSIRGECLDHVMVWNQRSLRRPLQSYFAYYQRSRTHLALGKDAPLNRSNPVRPRLLSLTKLLLIQNGILSRHELPCTSMHTSTERGRHCQSLDSDMLANNETSVIDEICD